MSEERIGMYIDGFDDKIEGGILKGQILLLVGEPGSMKSSVAFNTIFNNARDKGTNSIYVTLEQSQKSLLHHMGKLGMNVNEVGDKIDVVDIGIIRKNLAQLGQQTWMQVFKMYTQNLKKAKKSDILVLDSLPALELLAKFEEPRDELFHFFEWLRGLDVTAILISEVPHGANKFARFDEDFLADAIVYLRMKEVDDVNVQRQIRCIKMRSTNNSPNYYSLLFSDSEFRATRVILDSK